MAEITARYVKVFNTSDGKIVLGDILVNLGMFEYNQTDPVSLERLNFARFLLKRLGILDPIKTEALIGSLMSVSAIPTVKRRK